MTISEAYSFSSIQSFSHVWLLATLWTVAHHGSLFITNSQSLLKLMDMSWWWTWWWTSSSRWYHPTISSSVAPFSCLQSFPALGSFSVSQLFTSGGQSIRISASASVSMNIQDWFPLGLTRLISLQSKGISSLLQHHSSKVSILPCSAFFMVQISHPYTTTGKTTALTRQTYVGKVLSLLFKILSRLVITFLPRSKRLLISWLQPPSAVILEPSKIKFVAVSTVSPSICHEWWEWMPWSSFFECWVLSQLLHSPLSLSSRGCLVHCFLP